MELEENRRKRAEERAKGRKITVKRRCLGSHMGMALF